jgi:hypothetical protein
LDFGFWNLDLSIADCGSFDCGFRIADWGLVILDFGLRIEEFRNWRLPIADLSIADCGFFDCGLRIADCGFEPIKDIRRFASSPVRRFAGSPVRRFDCRLRIGDLSIADFGLRIADFGIWILD